jgi:hypothetical protein
VRSDDGFSTAAVAGSRDGPSIKHIHENSRPPHDIVILHLAGGRSPEPRCKDVLFGKGMSSFGSLPQKQGYQASRQTTITQRW